MRRARILVVDDEPGLLRAASRVLGGRHEVLTSASPLEALALAARARPDLAIVDVRMPEMSGFDLTARLKSAVPGIDVILMTGSVSELDEKLVRAIREQTFYFVQKPFDREVLATIVERCLELRRLADAERRHTRRLEAELADARAFQRGLLPDGPLHAGRVRIDGRYRPSAELGGDFYDHARTPDGKIGILVADVSGHGAAAAMITGAVKASFHAAREDGLAPAAVLRRIRDALASLSPRFFVTAFVGRIAPGADELEWASAGHPPALLDRAAGGIERLASTGLILSAAFPTAAHRTERVALAPGDRLLVWTDGIADAGSEDDPFGEERLIASLRSSACDGVADLDRILAAVEAHARGRNLSDDCTLLLATIGPRASAARARRPASSRAPRG